jgi:hypothetical protein
MPQDDLHNHLFPRHVFAIAQPDRLAYTPEIKFVMPVAWTGYFSSWFVQIDQQGL